MAGTSHPSDQTDHSPTAKSVLAVVVLYKTPAAQSQSFSTLHTLLAQNPDARAKIDLIVCDNTPHHQPRPEGFADLYLSDPTNPGLAKCYNRALQVARERNIPWLLVLDQDTTPTSDYVAELCARADRYLPQTEVVAIVPKLANRGAICSPHYPPFMGPARSVAATAVGIWPGKLFVFNSGATLRVAALNAIGGFPQQYPLDFLDHATFARLFRAGGKLAILRATLTHDLSTNDHGRHDPALVPRQTGILDAEYRFYREYGSPKERLFLRMRLIRSALGRIAKGKNWSQTWRILKSAFRP